MIFEMNLGRNSFFIVSPVDWLWYAYQQTDHMLTCSKSPKWHFWHFLFPIDCMIVWFLGHVTMIQKSTLSHEPFKIIEKIAPLLTPQILCRNMALSHEDTIVLLLCFYLTNWTCYWQVTKCSSHVGMYILGKSKERLSRLDRHSKQYHMRIE